MTTNPDAGANRASGVKSARRVLDLLELLAREPDGLTFPALGSRLGLPKSSLHDLLLTLSERSWIVLEEGARRYRVGVRAWEVGQGFLRGAGLAVIADKHLRAARDRLDETVQLAILDGIENVYIAKVQAGHPLQLVSEIGSRLPAYATGLGKVLLAALPADELDRRFRGVTLERFTARTVTDFDELKRRLAVIRDEGYGTDDGEYTEGVFCVAAPIRDRRGKVVAAMSCSVPQVRLDAREMNVARMQDILTYHAVALSEELGWRRASDREKAAG